MISLSLTANRKWSGVILQSELQTYQADEGMYATVCEEPIHKGTFGRHHIWILLSCLFSLLRLSKFRPVVPGDMLPQALAVRRRDEFGGLLETDRLCGTCGGISTLWQSTVGLLWGFVRVSLRDGALELLTLE